MRESTVVTSVLGALAVLVGTGALACSAVGPNKHVGVVLGIDRPAQSFTVLDGQTNQPITFLADEAILDRVADAKGRILVDFQAEGSTLRATEVQF